MPALYFIKKKVAIIFISMLAKLLDSRSIQESSSQQHVLACKVIPNRNTLHAVPLVEVIMVPTMDFISESVEPLLVSNINSSSKDDERTVIFSPILQEES